MDSHDFDVRAVLERALPPVIPTTIDRVSAIAAGRRARTRRTWTTSLAGAVGILAIAGGVAWGQGYFAAASGARPIGVGAVATATASALPDPSTSPMPSAVPSTPASSAALDQPPASMRNVKPALTAALLDATHRIAPGLTIKGVKGAWANQTLAAFEVVASQGGYKAWAELSDSAGKGTVFLDASRVDFAAERARFTGVCSQPLNPGFSCTAQSGPNGELIYFEVGKSPGSAITMVTASVVKPDGTSLYAMVDNYSHSEQDPRNPRPQRTAPPLTSDQIVTILLQPAVTIAG